MLFITHLLILCNFRLLLLTQIWERVFTWSVFMFIPVMNLIKADAPVISTLWRNITLTFNTFSFTFIITISDPCSQIHTRRLILLTFPLVSSTWNHRCELCCCNSACRKSTARRYMANLAEGRESSALGGLFKKCQDWDGKEIALRMAAEHHRLPARPRTEPSESNPLLNTPSAQCKPILLFQYGAELLGWAPDIFLLNIIGSHWFCKLAKGHTKKKVLATSGEGAINPAGLHCFSFGLFFHAC